MDKPKALVTPKEFEALKALYEKRKEKVESVIQNDLKSSVLVSNQELVVS